jgi:hypothetical protein
MHGGLTPYELEIMELWDGGMGMTAIHRRLGKPLKKIRSTVSLYHAEHEQRDDATSIAAGSAALRDAILAAQPGNQA